MTKIFLNKELEGKYRGAIKRRKDLLNKHKMANSTKEKMEINRQIRQLDLVIEVITKQGSATPENVLKSLEKNSD